MPEIVVQLKLYHCKTSAIEKDIFKCAEFWLSKGFLIQTKTKSSGATGVDSNNVALDYYLSGVKIDPRHFGCIYNAACSYFFEKKFLNAVKWFDLALKIDPLSKDSFFGKTVTCLKLGQYTEALLTI